MEHGTELEPTAVTVCICTFRRPSVLVAVESVAKQVLPNGISVKIVVIDNDAETPLPECGGHSVQIFEFVWKFRR